MFTNISEVALRASERKCPVKLAFTREGKIYAIKCKRWDCPTCAKDNARLWAWRVRIHVKENGGEAFFWTFTLGSSYRCASDGFVALPGLWDRLRKVASLPGRKLSYCAFVEGQPKRGYMPHFHVVTTTPAPGRIKDMAVRCGFGYQAKEERVTSDKASFYVAKYATKQSPYTPRGFRRVRTSQDWAKLPDGEWPELVLWERDQSFLDYLLLVQWLSGRDMETIYGVWTAACDLYGLPNG